LDREKKIRQGVFNHPAGQWVMIQFIYFEKWPQLGGLSAVSTEGKTPIGAEGKVLSNQK
jgi:hypothetical protein